MLLYGECFCFKGSCVGMSAHSRFPELALRTDICENPKDGEVLIFRKESEGGDQSSTNEKSREVAAGDPLLSVPRCQVLSMFRRGGLQIMDTKLIHGNSETGFVACFQKFVTPVLERNGWCSTVCSCVVLSKDTDVTILTLAECLRGQGVVHVLGDTVVEIGALFGGLREHGVSTRTLSCVYVLAGCEFTAGTFGVTHEDYLMAVLKHREKLVN